MRSCLFSIGLLFIFLLGQAQDISILEVPGRDSFAVIRPGGVSVLPSGRFVSPAGKVRRITHDPFGMAVSPDGCTAVTLHNGVFTILPLNADTSIRVPDYTGRIPSPFKKGSLIGAAFGPDGRTVYLSGGDAGIVIAYDIQSLKVIRTYELNGASGDSTYAESFASDLAFHASNDELLVLDQANYRMVRFDVKTGARKRSIRTGRLPFGISITPDGRRAIVANVGMYAYPLVSGMTPANADSLMINRHPYGHNTPESINGTTIDGRIIPGVGDPNAPESMSVFILDLVGDSVQSIIRTGLPVGHMIEDAEVIGGASPNSIAIHAPYAYVTNATNDNIAVIDYASGKLLRHIPIRTDARLDKYRGYLPFGITIDQKGERLYVALLGFNAVAVIDTRTDQTLGLIPSGWGPTRVLLTPDGSELLVASCRGLGAGPNGGRDFIAPPQGTYVGDIQLASFQQVLIPDAAELAKYTNRVLANTFVERKIPSTQSFVPLLPGNGQTPIKHIVYITKENRTYDEVLGQLKTGRGDSTLARFGLRSDVRMKSKSNGKFDSLVLRRADVSPNHHRIAGQFAFSDNFYCDSDASIHGHHWMMGVIPNEWVETNSNTSKTANIFSPAPGRRFPGSTGSMDPEDFAETGGLWEALVRKGVSFYNFGEANETAHVREEWSDTATGAAHAVMVPMQQALYTRTSRDYAGYNTSVPDQLRSDQFEREFTKKWLKGKERMPSLITIQLPNDHTASPRPEFGYPYTHSYMADNDLALGRMLHFLSRTPYWKNMLVIVTEDDPQGGVDHVDAHRSILMLAGPYVKKGYTSHTHANFGSILRLIYNLLAVPYVNQYDVTASHLSDFFTDKPDFKPYNLTFPDKRVFDPKLAMKRYGRETDWRKVLQGPKMDDEQDQRSGDYREK
jgi:YVTN family beta-propeller protein